MQPHATNDPVALCVCLSRDCAIQKRLQGSRSCSAWRLLWTQATLFQMEVPIPLRRGEGGEKIAPIVKYRNIARIRCGLRQITLASRCGMVMSSVSSVCVSLCMCLSVSQLSTINC